MYDAASMISKMAALLEMSVITPSEFAAHFFDAVIHDEECQPAAIFQSLPPTLQLPVLELAREYAAKEYLVRFFYIGPGETAQDAIDRQPKLKRICESLT